MRCGFFASYRHSCQVAALAVAQLHIVRVLPYHGTAFFNATFPTVQADSTLDAQGLLCPEPLMLVRNRVREMAPGAVLHIQATDPSTHRDFVNFCRFMGHELMRADTDGPLYEYWIKKAS